MTARWTQLLTGWMLVTGVVHGCAQSRPAEKAPAQKKEPTLADRFPDGEPLGLTRSSAELVQGEDLAAFVGEGGAPVLACAPVEGARVRYRMEGDQVIVAMLLRFSNVEAARCGYDAGRPQSVDRLDVKGVPADRRPVPGLLKDTSLWVLVKGTHVARIFTPTGPGPSTRARALAQALAEDLPADGESALLKLLPATDLVPGSARVVMNSPVATIPGPVAIARYNCGVDDAVGFVALRPDPDEPRRLREDYQRAALEGFETVNPFDLGDLPVLSVLSATTNRETLLMYRGRLMMGVSDMARRRDCIPAIEAMAALADPTAPLPVAADGGVPDAG